MVFEDILAIQVGMQGIESVKSGFDIIAEKAKVADAQIKAASAGFVQLGVSIGIGLAGIREAMEEERSTMQLKGYIEKAGELKNVLSEVRTIAEGGIFSEDEAYAASLTMERLGASANKYLSIAYNLAGKTSEQGSLSQWAALIGRIEGGDTQMLRRPLRSLGVTPDMMAAAGVGNIDKASKDELLAALEKISMKVKEIRKINEGVFSSAWMASIDSFKELLQNPGDNLMMVMKPVAQSVTAILKGVKEVDSALGGWGTTSLIAYTAISGIARTLPAIVAMSKALLNIERTRELIQLSISGTIAFSTGLYQKIVAFTKALLTLEIIRAAWQKIIATWAIITAAVTAPGGGWLLAGGIAGAALAIGGIAYANTRGGSSAPVANPAPQEPTKTGMRRSDFDNLMGSRLAGALG